MHLEFTAQQDELREAVRALLARECPPSLVRAVAEQRYASPDVGAAKSPDDRPEVGAGERSRQRSEANHEGGGETERTIIGALWDHMVELGWPALTVPEGAAGLGLGAVELAVVVEELGRVLAPGPLLPTLSQFVAAVREAGDEASWKRFLGPVATEGRTGSLAIAEAAGRFDPLSVGATARRDGDGWTIDGEKHAVVEAPAVDDIVVVAREPATEGEEGVGAFVVPRHAMGVEITPVRSFDPTRLLARVALHDVTVDGDRALGEPGPTTCAALRRAVEEATVALALESVGTCQTIFDVTLEYAKQREQFGVPIGSFQAIKHKFADMLMALERARATGYFAALTIAEDDERRSLATSMAKAAADDAQRLIAKEGIQIHGGIGYTWEHGIHFAVRRAKADAALFGGGATHRARVADLLGW